MSLSQFAAASHGLRPSRKEGSATRGALSPLGLARGLWAYRRHQRDCRRLLELPDYLLQDVGLTREQVTVAMQWRLF